MKLKLFNAVILAVFMSFSVLAEEHGAPPPVVHLSAPPPATAKEKEDIGYALGQKLGLQRKEAKSDMDINAFTQGVKDVMENKPTKIAEADLAKVMSLGAKGTNLTAEEKSQVTYASGMRTGLQLKNAGADFSADAMLQALHDTDEGKPAKFTTAQINEILSKGRESANARKAASARVDGEAFLTKNATAPGVQILPDGLQYKIIKEGTGNIVKTNDHIFIRWKGKFINGVEFEHHNHFPTTPTSGYVAWQDALQRMKVGSKWEIYCPPALTFGTEGEPHYNVPPDSTVIFELEIREVVSADDPRLGLGRMGHGIEGRDDP